MVSFLATRLSPPGTWCMERSRANGQPAVVMYERGVDGYIAHGVTVFTFVDQHIARITLFLDADLAHYFE